MVSSTPIKLICYIEELAANAWPAFVIQVIDGWRLRFNRDVTRRANSVWSNDRGNHHTLDEKLLLVEDFYTRWGVLARYQICPAAQPADLDAVLANRGYITDARTSVQIALLSTVIARTHSTPNNTVTISEKFDEQWFATYCEAEQVSDTAADIRRGISQRIGPRAGYALLKAGDRPIALGLGVVERGWIGVFSMATRPEFRHRGAATAVLHALAKWAERHQAAQMYLQVMEDNAPAFALYERAGFETLYYYHYWELAR